MRPHEWNQDIIGMKNYFDVGAEFSKVGFSELRVNVKCHFGTIIDNDVDLYACVGNTVKNIIHSELRIRIWSFQGKIRRNHPTCDKYLFFGPEQPLAYIIEVPLTIDVVLSVATRPHWRKTVEPMIWGYLA